MDDYVLFQMWGPFRASLIDGHEFYVKEARSRLLSRFDDIEAEADKAADDWLAASGSRFDPDQDDPGSFYEAANEIGIQFYQMLSDMREHTRLSVVAGMFHQWDKQLRDWLVREIQHWHHGENVRAKVWAADFGQIADLLESFGWQLRATSYYRSLDACRLVVNVYKHGEGRSFDELKELFPEYLHDPFAGTGGALSDVTYRDHTALKVSDAQFQAFANAMPAFWQGVPENVIQSNMLNVPDWFGKAILKDHAVIDTSGRCDSFSRGDQSLADTS